MGTLSARTSSAPSVRGRSLPVVVGCALASALIGAEIGRHLFVGFATLLMAGLVLCFVVARHRPRLFFALVAASLSLVPVYASPAFGGVLLEPTAALLWILAAALWLRPSLRHFRTRLTAIDVSVIALFLALALSVLDSVRSPNEYVYFAFLWLGPYLACRLLIARMGGGELFQRTLALAGVVMVPFVFVEATTGTNFFHSFAYNASLSQVWVLQLSRLTAHRASGSFGHPIALSMFLATAALFCFGQALHSRQRRRAAIWVGAAAVCTVGQALTLSRTGWVVLLVGLAILLLGRPATLGTSRVGLAAAAAVAALALLPQASPVKAVFLSSFHDSAAAELAPAQDYRRALLARALTPGELKPLGSRESAFAGSLDNEYVFLADRWGLVSLGGFLLVLAAVAAGWRRQESREKTIYAVTLANLIGLVFVAMITQQQIYIWMLIGACAGLQYRRQQVSETP